MPTQDQVMQSLAGVFLQAVNRSIVGLNMVREVTISGKRVKVTLASTGLIHGDQDWTKNKAKEAIETLPGVNEAEVVFAEAKPADLNKVEHKGNKERA